MRPAPSVPSRNRLTLHALGPCEAISSRGLGLTPVFDRQRARHTSTLPNCAIQCRHARRLLLAHLRQLWSAHRSVRLRHSGHFTLQRRDG